MYVSQQEDVKIEFI